jgi:restriction endonuclease S subunit
MLKRSQVSTGDLLVKITGVGRMAVASVAPEGFDGNINQHICVIKTGSREISETLAAFLNSDIGERLASRRSTGGTRPALDYPALLSIPVLLNKKIVEITRQAVEQKKRNEQEAEKLLSSIDDYLMSELGITLPTPRESVLKNRIYTSSIKSISGNRFDPFFHQKKFNDNIQAITNCKFPVKPLREIIQGNLIKGTLPKQEEKNGDNSVIQINCINSDGTISFDNLLTAKDIFHKDQKLRKGDILIVITGATIGKVAYWDLEGDFFLGGDIVRFQSDPLINSYFLYSFLRCQLNQIEAKRHITGATNGHFSPEDIKHSLIPIPPLEKQHELAGHICDIRQRAQRLKEQTNELLKKANEEIEQILLG